jgi:hypothetical protein
MRGGRIVVNDIDAAGLGPERSLNALHNLDDEFGRERIVQKQDYVARRNWETAGIADRNSHRCAVWKALSDDGGVALGDDGKIWRAND